MSSDFGSKINKLLQLQPPGVVLTSSWLRQQNYSFELLRSYRNNHWLTAIGHGAMIRKADTVDYLGAICALQQQLHLTVHPAGKTALSLLGKAHFLDFNTKVVYVFGNQNELLPTWFKNHPWQVEVSYVSSSFLPSDKGLVLYTHKDFTLKISSSARAMMECLYLVPQKQDFIECFEMMQGLTNLSPKPTQELLESCTSVKVKRLFLYLAEKSQHAWFHHLNSNSIDLGKGNRSIIKDGTFVQKYKITVPKELELNDESRL